MPNFFVIGASKSGTTSLHTYLDQHPDISMSRIKEPGYFLQGIDPSQSLFIEDRDRYLGLFEAGHDLRGESTVAYTFYPWLKGTPGAIAKEVPGAKFIYLVRDPISRILAMIRQGIAVGTFEPEDPSVPAEVRDWIGDVGGPENRIVEACLYMTQVRQYLKVFPRDSIMVVDSDDLRDRREETMAAIFGFLGCDPAAATGEFDLLANEGDQLHLKPTPYRWLRKRTRLRRFYRRRPDRMREALGGRFGATLGRPIPRPVIDDELRTELEDLLRPEVEALRDFTGLKFEGWSI